MPAAAVIPAPLAYTNVAAVKKLVVGVGANRRVVARGLWRCPPALHCCWCPTGGGSRIPTGRDRALPYPPSGVAVAGALDWVARGTRPFYFEKIRVFKAGAASLHNGAWNNRIGPRFYCVGLRNWR